ncbi:hypothetical protein HY02_00385 [Peptococcaceae bacterium SCADC1_2_3]|jgi:RecB family endonuclease NucS|nr:hypothetical protein DK28_0209835 [Peptococcaceae bacterium SCADC1_2_3]KFI34865.1 hypothetical protein HY00_09005 [Peptococcaceae bacterium SCADC1_2_3]KFI38367.1 hypothetical protein HY02_00385 [Peptococcaceae bacterium SCADC1_2_3]
MGTEIKTWQIIDGKLASIESTLKKESRTEPYDLEPWLASNPEIMGTDIMLIGRQIMTKSGPIDLLGIDKSGNTVIIEIKRSELPRESLAQAIDYASDVAEWTVERLGEVCSKYTKKTLQESFNEFFPDVDLEIVNLNSTQRIILVGFSIEASLERMIEWLSDSYGVNVNAVVLSYIKTKGGEELLTKTSIISEEMEEERRRKQKKFEIQMSDDPGTHDHQVLKQLLRDYLSRERVTNQRMRDILFPALLKTKVLIRDQLKKAFVDFDPNYDESKVGYYLTLVSSQLGMKKNDFLRQVVVYEYPRHHWEKDNFAIRSEYQELVREVLEELKEK